MRHITLFFALLTLVGTVALSGTNRTVYVDAVASPGGDGSREAPFQTVQDGLAAARATWHANPGVKIVVRIAAPRPGAFYAVSGMSPLLLDVPLDLIGSNAMEEDADGWPTGVIAPGTNTWIKAVPGLTGNEQNMIRVVADNVTVANLTLDANTIGQRGVQLAIRKARDFTVRGNYLTGGSFIGIELSPRSARSSATSSPAWAAVPASAPAMPPFRRWSSSPAIARWPTSSAAC